MTDVNTIKEAIDALTCGFLDVCDIDPYMDTILETLEKQISAVPYKVGIDEYECPIKTCRGKLTKGYPCKCGKIIDWSGIE